MNIITAIFWGGGGEGGGWGVRGGQVAGGI